MSPRRWNPRELRMTADYLREKHPEATHVLRARLGPLPPQATRLQEEGISSRLYYPALHWADGLALYPDRTVLLEVKIKLDTRALGQILANLDLFRKTDEFRDRWSLPLEGEVVYAFPDRETIRLLDEQGIRHVEYCPDYIREYYLERIRATYEGPRPRPRGLWDELVEEVSK